MCPYISLTPSLRLALKQMNALSFERGRSHRALNFYERHEPRPKVGARVQTFLGLKERRCVLGKRNQGPKRLEAIRAGRRQRTATIRSGKTSGPLTPGNIAKALTRPLFFILITYSTATFLPLRHQDNAYRLGPNLQRLLANLVFLGQRRALQSPNQFRSL